MSKPVIFFFNIFFFRNSDGQKAIKMICDMDWHRVVDDFVDEFIRPFLSVNHSKEFDAVEVAKSAMCIYDSINETNWNNVVNLTKFMEIAEFDLENL